MNNIGKEEVPIGKIIIDVYSGGRTWAKFSGTVPPNAINTCRVSLQRSFGLHMREMAQRENAKVADDLRIQQAKDAETARKAEEVRVAGEKAAFAATQKLKSAQADVEQLSKKVTKEMTPQELRKHEQAYKAAKATLERLQK